MPLARNHRMDARGRRGVKNLPYLLSLLDSSAGADDNFVSSLKSDHLSHAVGRTRMVDVPTKEEWDR